MPAARRCCRVAISSGTAALRLTSKCPLAANLTSPSCSSRCGMLLCFVSGNTAAWLGP